MTSSYHGIFAHKLSDGTIISVQVEDAEGIGNDLPVDIYRQRCIQPPAETLPDQQEYKANS